MPDATGHAADGSRAPRVLMYTKYVAPRYSGAGRQALTLASALRRLGVECRFLTESTLERPGTYEVEGFPIVPFVPATEGTLPLPSRGLALWRALRRLGTPDVFHAHSAYPEASLMGVTARLAGVPSLLKVTMHDSDVNCRQSRFFGRVHRQLLLRQDAIIAISSEIGSELRALGVRQERIRAIPNGVDTDRFRPLTAVERRARRGQFGLEPDRPVVLFVGILNARKNVGWLLDRWLEWSGRASSTLVLAGPSPAGEERLRARIESLGQDPASGVRWLGEIEAIEQLYPVADLFVLPSHAEGLPNVALEAMASGVPVALADCSGARDVLGPVAEGGWLLPLDDGGSLHRVLDTMAGGSAAAAGHAARQRVEGHFAMTIVARRYLALYEELRRRR